jgi:hypothetical protein
LVHVNAIMDISERRATMNVLVVETIHALGTAFVTPLQDIAHAK